MGTKLLSCMFPVMTSMPSRCSAIIAWSSCERTGRLSECLSQHTAMSNVSKEQEKITVDAVGRHCHMTRARFVLRQAGAERFQPVGSAPIDQDKRTLDDSAFVLR